MAKQKIKTINGKRLVVGNVNELTNNEILVEQKGDSISLKERVNGEIKELSSNSGGSDTPSTPDEQVIKYYKINIMYNDVNYADKWRELLKPFVERVESIRDNDASIRTCLYSGTISSNYGNTYRGIVTGDGENLSPSYVSDAWYTIDDPYSGLSVYTLPSFLQDKTIDGIPNLLDCITEVSQKEFFNCAIN